MNTFFITGVQRSGTTLLSVLLSKHPDVLLERRSIAFRIISCFKSLYDVLPYNLKEDRNDFLKWLIKNDAEGRLAKLMQVEKLESNQSICEMIQQAIDFKLQNQGKQIWGDKSPNLEHFLNDISLLMPKAKILHIVRDGRAVAYSMSTRSSRNLLLSAQKWVDGNIQSLVNQQIVGKKKYHIIRYEDLLNDPQAVMRSVCRFLNISYVPEISNPGDSSIDDRKKYVKSELDQTKIDKWKQQLSKIEILKIEKIQGPLLQKLGYELNTLLAECKHQPISVWRKIRYNQVDNFRMLFRNKRIGMIDRENVTIDIPLKGRVYSFFKVLTQDFMSVPIFKTLFPRVYYKQKYFTKKIEPAKEKVEL